MAVETRLAAISENMSLRRHLEEYVKPWLSANAKAMEKKLEKEGLTNASRTRKLYRSCTKQSRKG
jgi:hypothetical protein